MTESGTPETPAPTAQPGASPDTAGVAGAPDSDPARFEPASVHAGSESGALGTIPEIAPVTAVQPPPLPPRVEIEEVSQTKRKWILELHPDHFALHSEFEPRPWVFTRDQMWDKVELMPAMGLLTVKAPRGVGFKLGREGLAAFRQWLGPPTPGSLRGVLKKRFSAVWVSALIILGMSMPSPRFPLNPICLALGLLLAGAWAWGMWRPARIQMVCLVRRHEGRRPTAATEFGHVIERCRLHSE